MKIIQNIAKDLFLNKTETGQTQAQGNQGLKATESEASLGQLGTTEATTSTVETGKEAIDAETLEALTEERPLTPEEKKQVAQLMKDPQLTKQEKIEAISLMLRKRLPLTQAVMQSVHEGLTQDLLPSELRAAIATATKGEDLMPTLLKALLKEISGNNSGLESGMNWSEAQLDDLFFEQMGDVELGSMVETVNLNSEKKQPLQSKGAMTNPAIASSQNPDDGLLFQGHVSQENKDDMNAMVDQKVTDGRSLGEPAIDGQGHESLQEVAFAASAMPIEPVQGKIYLRQEVKEAMKNAKVEFENFKKTTLEQLKAVEAQPVAALQKQSLQRTIEAVDKVLMKSDIPLYTSMKMEKKLLVLSASLTEVKKLVEQGKLTEAKAALKPIMEGLEAMSFKPSSKKMIYQSGFINSMFSQSSFNSPGKGLDLTGTLGKQIAAFSEVKGSPRMVLEHLRSLGFNLEGEKQQGAKDQHTQQTLNKQKTIYQVLEALDQETEKSKLKPIEKDLPKEVAQSLGNHRLINKLEEGSPKQTLDLTIPYRSDQGVFELKVHVEARKQDELLDWENFKMFFVLDTQKSGQIGIGVHTVDKKLSLTFKAENRRVVSQLGPMVDALKQSLVGVGYQLVGIQYGLLRGSEVKSDLQAISEETTVPLVEPPSQGRKGVDFKV